MKIKTYNLSEVLATLSSDTNIYGEFRIEGDVNRVFCNIKPAFDANIDSISWVSPNRSDQVKLATNTQAGILVLPFDLNVKPSANQTYIFAENPKLIFATIINNCIENLENLKVHDTAIIDPLAQISSTAQIGAHTLIGNCSIGKGSIIGDNCSILDQTVIGENVKIGSGARIGNLGYGYAIDGNGSHIRFPHLGGVEIYDNVEIGANTCIDRGSLGNTVIHSGVKIDNLVHIAHNVQIMANARITALAMIAGSVVIGENAYVAPCSSITDTVEIGSNSFVGLGATVTKSIPPGETWAGYPARKLK